MESTLNYKDFEKLRRLRRTFDLNYRLTHLLAGYLNVCPELIQRAEVDALCRDAQLTREEAVAALLSAYLLDEERPEDRALSRDYLAPAVRMLDRTRYESDPYYRAVRVADARLGKWELINETYAPYRAVVGAEVIGDC